MKPILLKMALLNLTRSRARTLITLISIAVGAASALLFHGYARQTYHNLSESFAHKEGHLQVAREGYFAASRSDTARSDKRELEQVAEAIAASPEFNGKLRAMTTRRKFSGLVSTGEKTSVFSGYGVDGPAFERLASDTLKISQGRMIGNDSARVVLGSILAERIAAKVGDWISIFVTTEQGAADAMDVEVVGIKALESRDRDSHYLLIDEKTAMDLTGSTKTDVLIIGLIDTQGTDDAIQAVQGLLVRLGSPHLVVRSWMEIAAYYRGVKHLYDRIFLYIQSILLILTLVTVANAVTMAVMERGAEIAMLRAMGASRSQVGTVFLLEGALLGGAGALLGVTAAFAMAAATRALGGIPMPPPPNETEGYRIFFLLTVNGGILIVSLTLIGTVAASVFPAASAARKNVARGLAGALLLALPMTGASWSSPALAKATPSAQAILQAIDARRDTPQSGFVTEVRFTSFVSGRLDAEMLFKVAGLEGTTLAFNVSSPAGKRMAILSEGKGMWMQKEGMRKSFRVSPAQRLMGGASNADVITVHFATDYVPSEMKVSGTKYMLVLAPKPGSESAAYGKIRVIATADGQVTAGEFYAVSGKLLKTSRFAYSKDATKSLKSALITDALRPNETTRVDYGAIVPLKLAESFFNIQNMLQSAQKLVP